MEPIFYKHTDVAAPIVTKSAGSVSTLLKACLVTGYGDINGSGWSILHEDLAGNILVLRSTSPKSMGCVLHILDNSSSGAASVIAYKDWDTINNKGVEKFGEGYFSGHWVATSKWFVMATDRFFYLFLSTNAGTNFSMNGFGDVKSLDDKLDFSALIAPKGVADVVGNFGYTNVDTSMGTAYFPRRMYKGYLPGNESYGASYSTGYASSVVVLTDFALYIGMAGSLQPLVQLPGLLIPYAEITVSQQGAYGTLDNQLPYRNPIVCVSQSYFGYAVLQMDDWG